MPIYERISPGASIVPSMTPHDSPERQRMPAASPGQQFRARFTHSPRQAHMGLTQTLRVLPISLRYTGAG